MTLVDVMHECNLAGIRLVNAGGYLDVIGEVPRGLKGPLKEHTAGLLGILPSVHPDSQPPTLGPSSGTAEADAIQREANGHVGAAQTAAAIEEWEHIVHPNPGQENYRLLDWRLEWLHELGVLWLRYRDCQDLLASDTLKPFLHLSPTTCEEWIALGTQLREAEDELRQMGKLPPYHWPKRD